MTALALAMPCRSLRRPLVALLQLLVAAAATVALFWVSQRALSGALARADLYGDPPYVLSFLADVAIQGLAFLPMIVLTALWLRDLGRAPVPRELRSFVRAVLGAWGYVLATLLLWTLLLLAVLALFPVDAPDWQILVANDLLLLLLWVFFLPRALARLCAVPRDRFAATPLRRLASLAILAVPAAADLWTQNYRLEEMLFVRPEQQPWLILGWMYGQALLFGFLTLLALLLSWRLLRPRDSTGATV